MRFSPLVDSLGGPRVTAWDLHTRAAAAAAAGEDVIVLSVGDPDFATPAPVVEAAVAALRAGDTHYTETPGRPALRAAIAARHRKATGLATGAENVIVTAGAQNALFSACLCLFGPGDEVLVPEPMYLTYEASVRAGGATLVAVPCPKERELRPDPALLAGAIGPRTRGLLLANPSNPTGVVLRREEAEAIAQLVRRHDLCLIADEVYEALVFDRPHISLATLPGMAERTITISSLSKSHAMTGWRLGWAIAPAEVIGQMANLALCSLYGLPGFVQAGALEALARHDEITAEMRMLYRRRCALALAGLARVQGVSCLAPEAGMFLLVDVSATGLAGAEFAEQLYAASGVSVLDAGAFGPSAADFVRLSFAVAEAEIREATQRIARYTAGLMAPQVALPASRFPIG